MADKSKIEWTDATWNPMTGCTPKSAGCDNCYARRMAERFKMDFWPTFHMNRLDIPSRWRKPRRVFVCSMSDLFHQQFTDDEIRWIFDEMSLCEQHTFIVLTKRPARMKAWLEWAGTHRGIDGFPEWPLPNVWLGVTAENQATADERIPVLLECPAAKRFVSIEPMLEPIDLSGFLSGPYVGLPGDRIIENWNAGIDWIICGGETGPGARCMAPGWVQVISDLCKDAGVPFFFKKPGDVEKKLSCWTDPQYADVFRREWPEVSR